MSEYAHRNYKALGEHFTKHMLALAPNIFGGLNETQ